MKVRTKSLFGSDRTTVGFYGMERRYGGDEFEIKDVSEFSHKWMEALDFDPPPPPKKEGEEEKPKEAAKVEVKAAPDPDPDPEPEQESEEEESDDTVI